MELLGVWNYPNRPSGGIDGRPRVENADLSVQAAEKEENMREREWRRVEATPRLGSSPQGESFPVANASRIGGGSRRWPLVAAIRTGKLRPLVSDVAAKDAYEFLARPREAKESVPLFCGSSGTVAKEFAR